MASGAYIAQTATHAMDTAGIKNHILAIFHAIGQQNCETSVNWFDLPRRWILVRKYDAKRDEKHSIDDEIRRITLIGK
jgi:hypothetical protein